MTIKSWFYDHFIAGRYDAELAEATADIRRVCIDRLELKPGDTVLDLGCGTGLNQPFIAEQIGPTGRIIGVDASEKMLDQAKDRADRHGYGGSLQLIHGDLRNLSRLVNGPVDAIAATLIFSVVPDWRNVFDASFAMLKPGGHFGSMDNYWPKPSPRLWFLSWTFAANPTRRGFEPLERMSEDFVLEYLPPDADVQLYVACGRKPAGADVSAEAS